MKCPKRFADELAIKIELSRIPSSAENRRPAQQGKACTKCQGWHLQRSRSAT